MPKKKAKGVAANSASPNSSANILYFISFERDESKLM